MPWTRLSASCSSSSSSVCSRTKLCLRLGSAFSIGDGARDESELNREVSGSPKRASFQAAAFLSPFRSETKFHVLANIEPRHAPRLLKQDTERRIAPAIPTDHSRHRNFESRENAEQCAFPGASGAHHHRDTARLNTELEIDDRRMRTA